MLLARVGITLGGRAMRWLLVGVFASLLLGGVELGVSLFLQLFLKTLGLLSLDVKTPAILGAAAPSPTHLAVGLCVLAAARSAAQFFVGMSSNVAMEMIVARLRRIAVWEMLLRPAKASVAASDVNARVGDLANKASQFGYAASMFTSSAVQGLALIAVMFFTASGETLIAMGGLGVIGLLVLRVNRVTRRVASNVPVELRVLTEGIARVANNTTLVRVLRTEPIEHRRLVTSIDAYARYLIHAAFLGNFAGAATPFAGILLIIGIVGASQSVLHTPSINLLSFLYLLVRFVQTLGTGVATFSAANTWWPPFEDSLAYVSGFSGEEISAAMRVGDALTGRAVERAPSEGGEPPSIALQNVAYRYSDGAEVFHDISVEIEKGSQLAIVGPSGCGKSTLLALVLGLFEPTQGEIRIGGRAPGEFFADPRSRVGYVGADAFLIAGSIRENLRYGLSAQAEDRDLWQALADARLREIVEALPDGLDYRIAEDGSGLSAGQKQRLCLARALLNRPHLLVLDEVSANLDADTEREIAESLKSLRGKCTTILVSHREGILRYADRVVPLGSMEAA